MRQQPGVEPGFAALQVLGVDGEPLAQREAGLGGAFGQVFDVWPGAFRVDVVGGERRDAAPVVDAGADQQRELGVHQVRRGLDPGGGAERQPGHRHRGGQVGQFGVRHGAHRGVRLGPEVLHDHFLHALVGAGHLADRQQRLGPLQVGLADADQHAGGERDGAAPGVLQHPQPDGGLLVRGAVVRAAWLGPQAGGGGLQHHAHRRGDRLEALEVRPGQHAGVQVRQQAGLLQHPDGHRPHVRQGVVVAVRVEPLAGLRPAVLGAVAEREQGFLAAEFGAAAGDLQHLVRGQVQAVAVLAELAGHGDEGAVVAAVPAEPGQRDEHLAGVRDDPGAAGLLQAGVADPGGGGAQLLQVGAAGLEQHRRLRRVQRHPVPGPAQRAPHRSGGGGRGGVRRGQRVHGATLREPYACGTTQP